MRRPNNRTSEQALRILFMLKKFLSGGKYTSTDLRTMLIEEFTSVLTLRTVQRDLRLLQECFPELEQWKEKRLVYWRMSVKIRSIGNIIRVDSNELLSFHVLKAHLKTFLGTGIEKDVQKLAKKLESLAPGNAFLPESLYWDQNFGYFDYSEYSETLNKVIAAINKKRWLNVTYKSIKQGTVKSYEIALRSMFSYAGTLYVVAYFPSHESHEALQLQGLISISPSNRADSDLPEFNYAEFVQKRFGIFSGNTYNITLKIGSQYREYFEGRLWHFTQQSETDSDGNLIIRMHAPIGMDLVSWILGWNDAITVMQPPELIEKVKTGAKKVLEKYI